MIPIQKIQNFLKKNKKNIFIINRTDEFLGEYIASYAERLNWISNFSGSSGRAIMENDKAYIFVDGRYTNQVNEQVDKNYFETKHIKDYWVYLKNYKKKNKIISLDIKLHSISEVEKMQNLYTNSSLDFIDNPIDLMFCPSATYDY